MKTKLLVLFTMLGSALCLSAATLTVTNSADSGDGTLRQAILDANADGSPDLVTIEFSIPGAGVQTIAPLTALPIITRPVTIDGYTQPGASPNTLANTDDAVLLVELNGTNVTSDYGLRFQANDCTVRGLVINGFSAQVLFEYATNGVVEGNFLGTAASGLDTNGVSSANGVLIFGGAGHRIGGVTAAARNVISGNWYVGINVVSSTGLQIHGNFIGICADGLTVLGSGWGISLSTCTQAQVGSAAPGARNVIGGHSSGCWVADGGNNIIQGNFIGTDPTGTLRCTNVYGLVLQNSPNNLVGGSGAGEGNLFSGNQTGIYLEGVGTSNNIIAGNFIGPDVSGTNALGNTYYGVTIEHAPNNTVGGLAPGARNVICGNDYAGVAVSYATATGNVIQGNYIGVDVTGTSALANVTGIFISEAPGNRVGGLTPESRNIVSGNQYGISLNVVVGTEILGNYVGLGSDGVTVASNTYAGIGLHYCTQTQVGGSAPGARNVISGNGGGFHANQGGSNVIQGNFIGTDASGTLPRPNLNGVVLNESTSNLIGGANAGEGNLISGNLGIGVSVEGINSTGNVVAGNLIGTDVTGTNALGNVDYGVFINSASGNVFGGTNSGARNIISANGYAGLAIVFSAATSNAVQGNFIGTDVTGTNALGNGSYGVFIADTSGNVVGGAALGAGNVISGNNGIGVAVLGVDATNNAMLGNSIFANVNLGIDLGGDGLTANDPGDSDGSPNHFENFPEIASATLIGGDLTVKYLVDSTVANSAYPLTVEFFHADPNGQGKTFLYRHTYTTPQAVTTVSFTPEATVNDGDPIVATATDANGNTSEFSAAKGIVDRITVSTNADSGPGSLRQAIADAVPGETIDFSVTGTILLASQVEINKSLTFTGPGATNLVIRGSYGRISTVTAGPTVISGLTLSHGWDLFDAQPGGGAILNTAHLTLSACELSHNESSFRGGAVCNAGGSATLIAEGCTFSDNSMSGGSGNGGGAIWSDHVLRITNCTFWNNYSVGNGGAVDTSGDAVIASSTIVGNRADNYLSGGGIFNGGGTLALQSSILSGNLMFYGIYQEEVGGSITSGDYNLINYTNGLVVPGTHNVLGQDPILSPLTYLGGPTRTFGLASSSPAVDAGDGATSPATDQRGVLRPQGGGYDIGAFEGALPPNNRPELANPIPDQFTTYQAAFNYTIPANTFSDPDAGQALTYSYSLGYPPPDLVFNPTTRTFSGIFRTAGTNAVVVTVTDNGAPPLSSNVTFNIIAPKLPITARADDASRVIGQFNPSFAITYYGLAPGDAPYVINNAPFATTTATEASPLGTYPIEISGGSDDVYEFVGLTNGTLTVTRLPLHAEAANASRGVGQTNQPFLGLLTGVIYGDSITATYTSAATPASPAGDYLITPVLHDPDGRLGNYDVTLVNGTLTVESDAVNPDFEVLHTFGFTNRIGGTTSELIEGSDGWLYGTGGGVNGMGVFKIQKDGTGFIVVRAFSGAEGGARGSLLEATNGVLYGGGDSVWSMNRDGSGFTVLHQGGASGLLKGSDGLFYGIGRNGVAGTVFQIEMDGSNYTVLHTFDASYLEGLNQSQLIEGTNGMLYGTASSGGPGGSYGDGTIFSLDKDGSNFSVLHSFTFGATDGANPKARLLQGSDGRLYGTAVFGGPGYGGVVFSLKLDGSDYTLVKTFDAYNPIEGINPTAPLIESGDQLYGTTTYGGPTSYGGTAFRMNKDGSGFSVIKQFGPTPDLYEPQYGLLLASDGALYGATSRGGTSDLLYGGGVFKLNKDGSSYQLLYSFSLSGEDGRQPVGVREASDGMIYGTTQHGGTADRGTVFRMNKDGSGYDVLHSFTGSPGDGRQPFAEVMEATDTMIYGTTSGGGTNGAGTVFRMNKDGSGYAILHDFTGDLSDGSGPSGGLTEVTNGKLYGTTINGGSNYGGTIFSMNKDGSGYSLVHEFDSAYPSPDGSYPRNTMVMDANGVLYGTTSGGGGPGNVFKLNTDGTGFAVLHELNSVAGEPVTPSGLLLASDGALYGAGNNGVFKLNRDGTDFQVLHTFGPSQAYSLDASYPDAALAEGADGRIYGTTVFGGIDNSGTIFRLKKDGTSYGVLYRFAPPSTGGTSGPNKPAFFRASDGSLYATTGGDLNFGTVFRLNFSVNAAPILANLIPDQNGNYGLPFNFTFAANTFGDPDMGQALNYTASGLPSGITFDGPTRTFGGTPAGANTFAVIVTATDFAVTPFSTNDVFNIVVAKAPLTVTANNTNRPYGELNPLLTGALAGIVNSDNITATFNATAVIGSLPGDYPISPALLDPGSKLGNYTVSTNLGTLTVNGVTLEFSLSGGSPSFCWPTNAADFGLEYSDTLTPPIVWQSVTSGLSTNGSTICVTATPSPATPTRFYRLNLP